MRGVIVCSLLFLSACYTYTPATDVMPGRQAAIRARLSEPSSFTVGTVSLHAIHLVEGEVVRWDDEHLILSATWLQSTADQGFSGEGQTLVVPRDRIAVVERKNLSKLRTAGVVGLGTVAGLLVRMALPGGGSGGSSGSGGPPATK